MNADIKVTVMSSQMLIVRGTVKYERHNSSDITHNKSAWAYNLKLHNYRQPRCMNLLFKKA